jgi:hypothetical protein
LQHYSQGNPLRKSGLYLIVRFAPASKLQGLVGDMVTQSYDIFRRDTGGEVWVEAVRDLETAKNRIIQLSADTPGQYLVFSQRSGRMVGGGTVVASPTARATFRSTQRCNDSADAESETFW